MSSTRLPTAGGGGNTFLPKYITLYVLIAGIGGGLVFVFFILYCCRLCIGRRLPFGLILSRATAKDSEAGVGTGTGSGSAVNTRDHGTNGTTNTNTNTNTNLNTNTNFSKTATTITNSNINTNANGNGNGNGNTSSSAVDKKSCVVQYSSGSTQIVMTGGLQRRHSDEKQGFLSRSPRDSDGFKTCSTSGGRPDDNHYKSTINTPPHSPHYLTSTVISIEPSHRNVSPSSSSSSSSVQLDHHSTQNSDLPSPRSPKSRHNSGGSSLSRCGSRGSTRENRASMKSTPNSRNTIRPRPVGGSLKDSRPNRRVRGGDYLTINPDVSPRRSVSLRSPRHPTCRSPQSKDGSLLPLYVGSENSVCMARDRNDNSYLKFNPSPTMSTHSLGQWTPLEQGLEWWKRKHKLQLVQHENPNEGQSISTKVRYNDIGSMEDIRGNEFGDFLFADSNEETVTPISEIQPHQIKHQYRALWELRATLEEEDWKSAKNPPKILGMPGGPTLSPTILPKDDQQALLASSPDRDPLSSHTTSFESNTETIPDNAAGHNNKDNVFHQLGPTSHASLASRRQSYKNVLQNRMKRLERTASIHNANANAGNMTETTTSFDSIETQESTSTDTTASRLEAMTTSMESTDNTDSTGESHHHHHPHPHSNPHSHNHSHQNPHSHSNPPHHSHHNHNQNNSGSQNPYGQSQKFPFRCDSGYKSLENGPSPNGCNSNSMSTNNPTAHLFPRRCLSSSSAADTSSSSGSKQPLLGSSCSSSRGGGGGGGSNRNDDILSSSSNVFFAKVGQGQGQGQGQFQLPPPPSRNVTRKRRDFGRFERHSIGSLDSVREPLDEESCGSGNDSGGRGGARGSLFYKYFRNPRSNSAYYTRDYSIDEKSDQLFREFSRCDPSFDLTGFSTATKNPATSPRSANGKMYARRSSSARGATSFDFPSTSSNLVGGGVGGGPYLTNNKPLSRRASQHNVEDDFSESSRLLPSTRFHNSGGHQTSIPIITVDDS